MSRRDFPLWHTRRKLTMDLRLPKKCFHIQGQPCPPLENANEIIDIIGEHMENVVIRGADPQREMDMAARRIAELM